MFFRVKHSGTRQYLQIVQNARQQGKTRQQVLVTLGRLEQLQEAGQLDSLLASGARFAEHVLLLTAHPYLLLEYLALHRGEVITLRMEGLLNVLCVFGFGRGAGRSRRGSDRLGHPANSSPA